MPKREKPIEPEENIVSEDRSSQILSNILKENKSEHFNYDERVEWKISSGSLLLDEALGGYIGTSLIRLCGANNEGKTPEALEIIRNFFQDIPNSRAFWILAEGRLSRQNKERSGLTFVYNTDDWVDGTIFVFETNVYDLVIDTIKNLVVNNPQNKRFCFCIDSMDGLISRGDVKKTAEESARVAGPAVLSKKMMQSLSLGMFKYGHLMLLISQVTSEIKLDKYAKTANRGGNFSGGNSLLHQSDFILEFQNTYQNDYILDPPTGKLGDGKTKSIGKWAKVLLVKSTEETTRKQVITYPIKFGKRPSGIWLEYEVIDKLTMYERAIQKGAWISLDENLHAELVAAFNDEVPKQFNGINKFRQFLEENPDVTQFLFKKIKDILI